MADDKVETYKGFNVQHFFIKDQVNDNEISVEYCPTEEMVADFFTKPLQGKLCNAFRHS
jgi:phenolic acid decarboxylase